MLPHNTLAVCSPPTPLAGCGDVAVTVDPTRPPWITCVEACAPVLPRHVTYRHANIPPLITTTTTRMSVTKHE
jgi:hypothetical protein